MNEEYLKLVKYVGAASDLAEAIEVDIKSKSRTVSTETVLALSKFVAAAHSVKKMLDTVESSRIKLN